MIEKEKNIEDKHKNGEAMNIEVKGDKLSKEIIIKNIGNYILLGGKGWINGLNLSDAKFYYQRIMEYKEVDGSGRMYVRRYHKKDLEYLPEYEWDQEFIIITPKEYKKIKKIYS
ncbi:MAG: hypothetical protein ACP5RX_03050 [Minisyncoccia bacterium]